MDSERYNRMKDIFVKVADTPVDERVAVLEKECGADKQLRMEVEQLLQHHDAPTSTITDRPASTGAMPSAFRRQDEMPSQIGGYRIIRELGRGGMGLVYLGVREEGRFQRRVAIKVVKKGMDTDDVLRRFELERQLLSALNHNNIARLYDAGTTEDGRPYFALEYVEGVPLDTYCDRNRLTIDERLQLFKQVCSAVEYAHRNLVVHRDIKPANIIVTSDGTVKLLDFGIAKLLNPELSLGGGDITAKEMRVMTPEYASPEQVRGEQITTASDVYSLGVLLYELMTGHRPYRIKERVRSEIERVICEMEPERPSTAISKNEDVPDRSTSVPGEKPKTGFSTRSVTPESVSSTRSARPESLRRRLAGDIDNIILMSMRKEPMRRYTSVEKLSEDIDRHLAGMPVLARPSSFTYRASKFVRRNKAGMAIAALLVVTVSAGMGMAWTGQTAMAATARAEAEESRAAEASAVALAADARANAEQERSQRRAMMLRELSRDFLFAFHDKIVQLEGSMGARQMLVATALEQLEEIERDQLAAADPELQRELASAYQRWGDVLGGTRGGSLGDLDGAEKAYTRAMEIFATQIEHDPVDRVVQLGLSNSYERMADLMWRMGRGDQSAHYNNLLAELAERFYKTDPKNPTAHRLYARALLDIGAEHMKIGNVDEATRLYADATAHFRTIHWNLLDAGANRPDAPEPMRALYQASVRDIMIGTARLASRHDEACRYDKAIEVMQESVVLRRAEWEEQTFNARRRRDYANGIHYVAQLYLKANNPQQAAPLVEETKHHFEHLVEVEPTEVRGLRDRASVYETIGDLRLKQGDMNGALESYQTFNRLITSLASTVEYDAIISTFHSRSHEALGRMNATLGNHQEAVSHYRQGISVMAQVVAIDPTDVRRREVLTRQSTGLGFVLLQQGKRDEALSLLKDAAASYQELLAINPESCERRDMLEKINTELAALGEPVGGR